MSFAAALTHAATQIHAPRSLDETLAAIVHAAQRAVPGIDHAGISIRHADGRIETLALTDQLVQDLDDEQYRLDQGPCVDAIRGGQVVVVDHAANDHRWPEYMPTAVERGLRAQLAVCLEVDGKSFGGLNLYSTTTSEVDPEAVHVAQLFATHAALALGWVRHDEQLNEALMTRKMIGQAIGIIMERYHVDEDRAFHFLLRTSSHGNIKLREVARTIVEETNQQAQQ